MVYISIKEMRKGDKMENLLNEELALTWGTHYIETTPETCIANLSSAYIEMWFCKAGRDEEDQQSLFRANCTLNNESVWEVDNYTIKGIDDYHKDIKDALCDIVCDHLNKHHK